MIEAVKKYVGLIFALGAVWLVVNPVLHAASPVELIGPAIGGAVLLGAYGLLKEAF